MKSAKPHTYTHDFGGGIVATYHADSGCIAFSSFPPDRIAKEYKAWIMDVHQQRADELGKTILYKFQLPGGSEECWWFEPGKPPRLAQPELN